MSIINNAILNINPSSRNVPQFEYFACYYFDILGAMSIFMLPQITSNRRYEWVNGFLCELVDVILCLTGKFGNCASKISRI